MKQIVLGTAGHIDHGKTSLIRALTGIETDRLKEEKARGITIELGFAHLRLPGGTLLGIVDVPGHEKFIKNMVAGATGIDLVAFVIAADEGIMPQTREHLEICELLKIKHALVVLTKIDMVEPDWLDLVREDVAEYLSGTFLAEAPVVEVSSVTGEGLNNLMEALDRIVRNLPERKKGHIFRLPIDRVFVMKGFGTVVTGTTISGRIHSGDEVSIYPQAILSRVRGIQVHDKEVEEVEPGFRTAINLQGLEKAAIHRGNILAAKDSLSPTYMVDVIFKLLDSARRKLKNRAKVRFHSGTSEIIATIILLDREELKPGETCFAQIRLDEPTALLRHDRYVIRSYSPMRTIGGGEILNALPVKKKRFSKPALQEMDMLHKGNINDVIELFVSSGRFNGVEQKRLPLLTSISKKKLDDALKILLSQKKVTLYDKERSVIIQADFLDKAREELIHIITKYHKDFPLKTGLLKEELRSRTIGAGNPKLFKYLINELVKNGIIVQEKELIRMKGHRVSLARYQQASLKKMEEIYLKSGLTPPYFKDIKNGFPGKSGLEMLEVLLKNGVLLKFKEDLYFHQKVISDIKERIVAFLKKNREITTPQFKQMAGVSRKYIIPILEYFDRTQLTVRVGDNRILREK